MSGGDCEVRGVGDLSLRTEVVDGGAALGAPFPRLGGRNKIGVEGEGTVKETPGRWRSWRLSEPSVELEALGWGAVPKTPSSPLGGHLFAFFLLRL